MTNPPNPENEPTPENAGASNKPGCPQQPPRYAPPTPQQPPRYAAPLPPQYAAPQMPQYGTPQPQPPYSQPYSGYTGYAQPGAGGPFDGALNPDDLTRPLYGATFGQAVRRFFKNYANFSGRASRSEYWWSRLFIAILSLVPSVIYFIGVFTLAVSSASSRDYVGYSSGQAAGTGIGAVIMITGAFLMLAIGLGTIIPSLAIIWRRLHDANFAGPFYFLSWVPMGGIVLLIFTIMGPKFEGRRFDR